MPMGFLELLLLVLVVLLFFGAGKLPALGEGLGKAFRGFKDAAREVKRQEPQPARPPKELPAGSDEPRR
jgi:sec-independent protein translocase protein TatA